MAWHQLVGGLTWADSGCCHHCRGAPGLGHPQSNERLWRASICCFLLGTQWPDPGDSVMWVCIYPFAKRRMPKITCVTVFLSFFFFLFVVFIFCGAGE